jgi:hypothetical protein
LSKFVFFWKQNRTFCGRAKALQLALFIEQVLLKPCLQEFAGCMHFDAYH